MAKGVECGFLALRSNSTGQHIEANDEFRETGIPRRQLDAVAYPQCFHKIIDIQQLAMALPESIRGRDKRILEIIEAERSCESYTTWRMGYGPREHTEMNAPDSQNTREGEVAARERAIGVLLTGNQPASTGTLQARYIPGPNSMARPHFVDFTTEGRDAVAINTGGPIQALRFVRPAGKTIRAADLPAEIQCGSGNLIIKRFNEDSFAIEEQNTVGDQIRVEIYHDTSSALVDQASPYAPASESSEPVPLPTIEVFYAYSHRDEVLRDELEKHLSILRRQGVITNWHDRRIGAGDEFKGRIDEHLNTADYNFVAN